MTVHELIALLEELPRNAEVLVDAGNNNFRSPVPEQVWSDHAENYIVVL